MEIRKGKNGSIGFREQIWLNGRCIKGPTFQRKTDAKMWKVKKSGEIQKVKALGEDSRYTEKILFCDYALTWLNQVVKVERAVKTHRGYEAILRVHLIPFFRGKNLHDISEADGRRLIVGLREKGHNGKGINNIVGLLKVVLNRAIRENYLLKNPLINIPKHKEELKTDTFWTKLEIMQFLRANRDHPDCSLFLVAMHTGMRLAELCGLCFDRIDFQRNEITVSRVRDNDGLRDTTKTGRKRIVPMLPIVRVVFEQLFEQSLDKRFVFPNRSGAPIDYRHVYRDFKHAQKRAGMQKFLAFHDLRHTFASQFMMNGGSLFDLQKILGHSDIKMTMRYAHFSPEHLQTAMPFMNLGVERMKDLEQLPQIEPMR